MEINSKTYRLVVSTKHKFPCKKCVFGGVTGDCISELAYSNCCGDTYFIECESKKDEPEQANELLPHISEVLSGFNKWVKKEGKGFFEILEDAIKEYLATL